MVTLSLYSPPDGSGENKAKNSIDITYNDVTHYVDYIYNVEINVTLCNIRLATDKFSGSSYLQEKRI